MRSDAMTARIPRRALESGKLDGNVVIRIYRATEGRAVDLAKDPPDVTVECPEAQFDAASGEIRCDRRVRIVGNALDFDGEGLSLSLSPDGKSIERLVVDRALAPVRLPSSTAMNEPIRPTRISLLRSAIDRSLMRLLPSRIAAT